MAFMRYSPLTILRVAVSRVERERGGAAYTVSLLARDDRHACGRQRARERVLAGRAEELRLEERQRPRDPAGDDDDVRVQAVHDRPDHRAERLARLVHDRRGEGVALRRGAEDEGSRDRQWIASRRPQQDGLRLARDAGPGRIRDASPARVEGQATTAAAPAPRAVELDGRVAELAAEAHGAPDEPTVEHEPGSEPGPGREYDERSGAPAGPEHPLAEGQRVDIVVDAREQPESCRELCGEGVARQLGDMAHGLADTPERRVDRPGDADPDGVDRPPAMPGLVDHLADQCDDRRERPARPRAWRRRARVDNHLTIGGQRPSRDRGAPDIDADDQYGKAVTRSTARRSGRGGSRDSRGPHGRRVSRDRPSRSRA